MRRYLLGWILFVAVILSSLVFLLWQNQTTELLDQSGILPRDISTRQYAANIDFSGNDETYFLELVPTEDVPLSLTLVDLPPFRLYMNGEHVYSYGSEDVYQRVQVVDLPPGCVRAGVPIEMRFDISTTGLEIKDIMSGDYLISSKVLVGGTDVSQKNNLIAFGFSMLALGALVFLIINSIVLYYGKPTEKYLLVLAFVSVVTLVTTMLTLNVPIVPLTHQQYSLIRPAAAMPPVVFNAAFYCHFLKDDAPRCIRRLLNVPSILLISAAIIVARVVSPFSFYNILRWALALLVVHIIACSVRNRTKGAIPLVIGYGISEGLVAFVFLISTLQLGPSGLLLSYFNLVMIGFLFASFFGVLAIDLRFADKFSESQRLSETLAEMNANLDETVKKRTGELIREQSRRHALMQNVFHDLRSPIFILRGYVDSLRVSKGEEAMHDSMSSKLSLLERLTEDLFLIAKLEDDAVLFDEDDVDIDDLVNKLEPSYRIEAQERRIELVSHAESGCMTWGDSLRIEQALQNLLVNALDHTPANGRVSISSRKEGGDIVISISDTGDGIEADELPLIFQRYYRSKTSGQESSGLGLSIANEIVCHHEGTIEVSSEKGRGTTMTVRLPVI